jgi:superfamily II DNA or RNA helicase
MSGEGIDPLRLEEIKAILTLKTTQHEIFDGAEAVTLELWNEEADGTISFPRAWGSRFFGPASDCMIRGDDMPFSFRGDLRPHQVPVVEDVLARGEPNGVVVMPCGTGKTVVALRLLASIQKRTLVIVHKEFLLDQWTDRIKDFLGIEAAQVGRIQQEQCEFDKPISIGMVHSLSGEREYPKEMYRAFGCVVSDECHRLGAEVWRRSIERFPAAVRIGLSATPRRSDRLENVFHYHIGPVIAKAEGQGMIPMVYRMIVKTVVPNAGRYWMGRGEDSRLNLAKLTNDLVLMEHRNEKIVKQIVRALEKNRRILLLSDRLEHLDTIEEMTRRAVELGGGDGKAVSISRYIGGLTSDERRKAAQAALILGTFQMAKEGLDIPELDVLILATPKGDVEQPVGRVLRSLDGKRQPVVLDIVDRIDTIPELNLLSDKRLRIYRQIGCDFPEKEATQT